MDGQALWLSLQLASLTTAILVAVALPLAYWLARGRGVAVRVAHALVALPLTLPPTVLGFYLLVAFAPRTHLGHFLQSILGHPLPFSFAGLVAGSVLYSLPFAVQPIASGFSGVDPALVEAASLLDGSHLRQLRRLFIPLARRSIVAAGVLTFTHTLGEFGVVLMLGGSIPGSTRTLSISIYDQVQDLQYAAANRASLLLLLFSFVTLLVVYGGRARAYG